MFEGWQPALEQAGVKRLSLPAPASGTTEEEGGDG